MNMRSSGGAGDGASEGDERNTRTAELFDERFAFGAVRMKCDIHGVAMVEPESVVGF